MKYTIDKDIILKDYLSKLPISKAMIKRIKREGDFLVNGKHQTVRCLLNKGDVLEIIFPQETSSVIAQEIPLNIIYEDDYYIILDKQPGIPCIPTMRYPDHTLANGIMNYYQKNNIKATVHLVNRLDKETSGYMLVAKDSQSHALLSKDVKQIERIYHCFVDGTLKGEGIIDKPILKGEGMKRIIDETGKRSITYYKVIKNEENKTLVECILETGRTHQIRVHLSSIGHPLCGDELYGSKTSDPIYLRSVEIGFIHPYTNQYIHKKTG